MKVLVTGGAGYLGSILVPGLLEQGHRVRVVDCLLHGGSPLLGVWSHPGFQFRRGDIRDPATVREALRDIDAVVHLAAIVGDPACARQPELARAVNLDATSMLLDESGRAGVKRLVFASTCSNYGKMEDSSRFVDEDGELRPVSLYAETKVAIERDILTGARAGAECATALRFATIYGVSPRMRFDLTVNEFTLKLMTHKRLSVYGEQFWRPYVHVRDAARGIALVLDAPVEKVHRTVFNVGSQDQNFRKKDLVEMILPYAPDAVVDYVKKDEDPRDYRVSFSRIATSLGYKITRTVPDGVGEVAELVRSGIIRDPDDASHRN